MQSAPHPSDTTLSGSNKCAAVRPERPKPMPNTEPDRPCSFSMPPRGCPWTLTRAFTTATPARYRLATRYGHSTCWRKPMGCKDRQFSEADITRMTREQKVPATLAAGPEKDPERRMAVLLRREAGPARITVFEGGHTMETSAALNWLARQRKGLARHSSRSRGDQNPRCFFLASRKSNPYLCMAFRGRVAHHSAPSASSLRTPENRRRIRCRIVGRGLQFLQPFTIRCV